jgi:hypothetical protein
MLFIEFLLLDMPELEAKDAFDGKVSPPSWRSSGDVSSPTCSVNTRVIGSLGGRR